MTDMLREELEGRLAEAEKSGDQTLINAARRAIDHASLLCQAHTAERIKKIEADAAETRIDVRDIKTQITGIATSRAVLTEKYDATTAAVSKLEQRTTEAVNSLEQKTTEAVGRLDKKISGWENQAKGMKTLWDLLKIVAGAGGGVAIMKALGA